MEPAPQTELARFMLKVALFGSLPFSVGALYGVFTSRLALSGAFMLALLLWAAVFHLLIFLVSVPRPKVSPYALLMYAVGCAIFLLFTGVLPENWRPSWVKDHDQLILWSLMAAGFVLLELDRHRRNALSAN